MAESILYYKMEMTEKYGLRKKLKEPPHPSLKKSDYLPPRQKTKYITYAPSINVFPYLT